MSLPFSTRAAALLAAVSATAVIVDFVADIGHPAPGGYVVLSLLRPARVSTEPVSVASIRNDGPPRSAATPAATVTQP